MSVEMYRTLQAERDNKGVSFRIKLPFFSIANDLVRKTVPDGSDYHYKVRQLVSGKIFKHEFCQK